MIEFNERDHTYKVDGVPVPSVSEVTECLYRMAYTDPPLEVMAIAAERGSAIHKATEELDKTGTCQISGDLAPYVEAYNQFLEDHKPEWHMIEQQVNNGTRYAGTLDRYGMLNGEQGILDIKTTSKITKEIKTMYTAAQNLYRMAIQDVVCVDKIWILQLKKDATYKLIELPIDDSIANACLTIHEALKKGGRRKVAKTGV